MTETLWNPEKRMAVFDGDLFVHAAANKYNDYDSCLPAIEYIEQEILFHREILNLDDFHIFATAGGNFRKEISAKYKANRKKQEPPRHLVACYKYLYEDWSAIAERGYEADDLLGIYITENPEHLLISYDKDLKQIPGWHYDWRHYDLFFINEEEADYYLAIQMLQGDRSDNVQGIKGIGPKKAEKLLQDTERNQQELLSRVWEVYKDNDLSWDEYVENYKLLKILKTKKLEWPELNEIRK